MQHIAAGKNAGHAGLQLIVHRRAGGQRRNLHTRAHGQLVLRDQAHRQQKRVAVKVNLRARDRLTLRVHLGHRHTRQALLALNVNDCVAQIQRNVIVVQALYNVAVQAGGIRHQLHTGQHLRTL